MTAVPDSSPAAQWLIKAEHDLRNAEHTLTLTEDCPFDTVAFHAQQCAEKALKGLLVKTPLSFPKPTTCAYSISWENLICRRVFPSTNFW